MKIKTLVVLSIALMFQACQEDKVLNNEKPNPSIEEYFQENGLTETKLGEKLDNPYSVSNMKVAYDSLVKQNNRLNFSSDIIQTTHYYTKFFVASAEDYDVLVADSLDLFEYPLDYKIESYGDYFIDEEDNQEGKWYYTVVPKDYEFGTIENEILEDLFMEEGLGNDNERISQKLEDFYYLLEDESLRLSGLLPENDEEENLRMPRKITPSGTLRVRNTETNSLDPVVGVKVKTRRLVKLGHGYTNNAGNYRVNKSYRYDVHYSVSFENQSGFKVWNTLLDVNPANFNGPKRNRSGWSYNFETNSFGWRFATVTNAVRRYLVHASAFGISHPHSNLRIAARNNSNGVGAAPMLRHTWGLQGFTTHSQLANYFLKVNGISLAANALAIITKFAQPDIMINAAYSNDNETIEVYETTFHELAHASHMRQAGSGYWVKYVNYIITYSDYIPLVDNGTYGDGTGKNAEICGIGEMWGNYFSAVCVNREFPINSVAFHLWETEDWYNPGFLLDVDNIPDVTTQEIFSSLRSGTTTFPQLINQLKTKTNNDGQVDNAFANYTDWP